VLLFFSFTKLCLSRLEVGSFSHKRVAIGVADSLESLLHRVSNPAEARAYAGFAAAGGAVHMPAMDLAGVGRMAMVADPQGAMFVLVGPRT
jgi:predicted enzyme related to lactoylglutathione lyase